MCCSLHVAHGFLAPIFIGKQSVVHSQATRTFFPGDVTANTLDLELMQPTVQLLEFRNLANEEITVPMRHHRVGNVDHIVVDVKVQLAARLEFALQPRRALRPHDVLHFVLEAQQLDEQIGQLAVVLLLVVHERGELLQRQRCVQLQIGTDGGQLQLLVDLFHEHLCGGGEWNCERKSGMEK